MSRTCSVPNCERPVKWVQLCTAHYYRKRKGRPLAPPIQSRDPRGFIEDVEWLLRCGTSPDEVAVRVGYPTNVRALERRLYRHGRADLVHHFKSIVYRERYGAA